MRCATSDIEPVIASIIAKSSKNVAMTVLHIFLCVFDFFFFHWNVLFVEHHSLFSFVSELVEMLQFDLNCGKWRFIPS